MEKKLIDLNEWEQFGGGGNGLSYYSRTDDSKILKLNKIELPAEIAEKEFVRTQAVSGLGIPCPQAYELVTDGTRCGLILQRINGKKSFARIISENPDRLDEIAVEFANRAKTLHSTECDTAVFEDFGEVCRREISASNALPESLRKELVGYIDSMEHSTTCLHGDFQPGNIIRAEGKDYWIDLGEFSYGDPDYDTSSLMMIARYVPRKVVNYLFHISREQFARFLEVFGQEYYGKRWNTPELEEKLRRCLMVRLGLGVARHPSSGLLFIPVMKGRKTLSRMLLGFFDLVAREYN